MYLRTIPFPPSVAFDDLGAELVAAALPKHGCLLARDLLDAATSAELIEGIDHAFDGFDSWSSAPETATFGPWFEPLQPEELSVHMTRPAMRAAGGVFTADSPCMFARWAELVHATGLFEIVAECFGEPPVTSLTKGTLRRVGAGDGVEWHQDGAFLGIESGAINVWVSLSDTERSPGLDIVPRRFDDVVPTGTHGARHDWSVGEGLIDVIAQDTPVQQPVFLPGDALIFDGLLLHRTAPEAPARPETRYAIETWFFRPSRFPEQQKIPLPL